ncbi:hypothetical protein FXN63_08250 [Pigmentiphaga aceris]|uniref:RidA family protein n=1 Tax=Pigmentiphaga aceris TaxID=1940612 RepID=A0A5C0AU01_9BURK|nr:hypothetical protein [Pigmentiphaga aceris]QEI05842.1 hypothetical protein FXN63_08250 [Pigmentiphaga aceris]
MSKSLMSFTPGGYAYAPGGFAYSQGVVALPGFSMLHCRFAAPVPFAKALARISRLLTDSGRPMAALCSLELRLPRPLGFDEFGAINLDYVDALVAAGVPIVGASPIARSNVAPLVNAPSELSVHGFTFTVPSVDEQPCFVVSGSSEWPQDGRFPEDIHRYGETSDAALHDKAMWTIAAVEVRMAMLGVDWSHATMTQSYSAHNVFPAMAALIERQQTGAQGVVWHLSRPPVQGWEYEMDVKGVAGVRFLSAS